jgi:hypothetical protein
MSWLFSQVLVEEYLGDICSDGEQSVQSNGKRIPQAYCAFDKMTDFSRISQFGMMCKPLMDTLGEELLMLYREDFRAKTLVPQEKELESKESDQECGEKWRGSFTKYDQNSCSWKTHQCSLLGDLDEFSETWPQWGLMRDGECWEQQTLAQTIKGTEYGLSEKLPTPQSSDHITKKTSASWKAKGGVNYTLSNPEIQMKWATPTTMDTLPPKSEKALLKEATQARPNRSKPANLRDQVSNMHKWPTPTTRDYKGANGFETTKKKMEDGLRAHMGQLPNVVQHMEDKPIGGSLNPMWVEWLMGWPLGWTDLKPLEMDKSHYVQQPHGES